MLQLNYPGHLGAKTGTTSMAGKTVVSAFKRGHRTLIVALMRYGSTMERASKTALRLGLLRTRATDSVGHLPVAEPRPPVEASTCGRIDDTEQAPAGGHEAAVVSSQSGGTGGSLKAIGPRAHRSWRCSHLRLRSLAEQLEQRRLAFLVFALFHSRSARKSGSSSGP